MRTWKQPGDSRLFTYDFTALLAGRTISSVVSIDNVARTGATQLTQEGLELVSTDAVQVEWSGGENGISYATTVKVQDSQGEEHELDGEILVAEITFTLPPGITSPYLAAEDYVARFGFEETVRITDEDRKGAVDGDKLQAALNDATDLANSYIGVRFDLPLATVPPVVVGIVADIAREKLYGLRVPQPVKDAADRARTMLKDIGAGRMALPDQDGIAVPETASGTALTSDSPHEGRVFNYDSMCGFGSIW